MDKIPCAYNVYIGQSIYEIEKNAFTIGFSKDNTRRSYTKHMNILNSYAFTSRGHALKAERTAILNVKHLGLHKALGLKYMPDELESQPNRTWTWFFIPDHRIDEFLFETNNLIGSLQIAGNRLKAIEYENIQEGINREVETSKAGNEKPAFDNSII